MSAPTTETTTRQQYVLGHSPEEQRRLNEGGRIIRPYTERLLREAGIGPGMRVLDVGCGTGDVTLIAAQMVGPTGEVVGLDRSADVLDTARRRAVTDGLEHVRFVAGDVATFTDGAPFDAVVGRLILFHVADRPAAVRHLASLVRPGGVVAFGDYLLQQPPEFPERPLYRRALGWMIEAFRRVGAQPDIAIRLPGIFAAAGQHVDGYFLEAVPIIDGDRARLGYFVATLRQILPAITAHGVASDEEVGIDTLHERLIAEAAANPGVACTLLFGGVWGRKR